MGQVAARLARAGCVAADEEAAMLVESASGERLEALVRRRLAGEPIEWIVGWAPFAGLRVAVASGVYVPRQQTEVLAMRAVGHLPADGVAVDLATGSGAVAVVLRHHRPAARVLATEIDPTAARVAAGNGVEVLLGDLDGPLPVSLLGRVDVLTANVPYVPTSAIVGLPREARDHEPHNALDGGADGLDIVRRVTALAPPWLRPRGWLLVEVGIDQADAVVRSLEGAWDSVATLTDAEGDPRAVEAQRR